MTAHQPDLFERLKFDGATYDEGRDFVRLHGQLLRVWNVMLDSQWRTLTQIAKEATALRTKNGRDSEAAVSARLRDFRKAKFGAHELQSESMGGGLWRYRLIARPPEEAGSRV